MRVEPRTWGKMKKTRGEKKKQKTCDRLPSVKRGRKAYHWFSRQSHERVLLLHPESTPNMKIDNNDVPNDPIKKRGKAASSCNGPRGGKGELDREEGERPEWGDIKPTEKRPLTHGAFFGPGVKKQ